MTIRLTALLSLILALNVTAAPSSDTHILQRLVPASAFHGVHGLTFDKNDVLYAGSVVGHSIYRVDTATGKVETVVGAPEGMADDLVFLADGTLVWTAISQGVVRARKGDGPTRVIANLVSINSINVRRDGRLFAAQVFGGDGVWELDPAGVKPPRSILKDPGGFNGFDIGSDGMLYGPLWFKRQVVRIDPDSGALEVIAEGFDTPAAANFDSKGNLYVLDTARGALVRVDIANGSKQVVAKLQTSLDNLAIDSKDRIFVSNMADNGIQEVDPRTGAARQVLKGSLAIPLGIAALSNGAKDTLIVADVFALRSVDGRSGAVTDIARAHAAQSPIEYPVAVSANDRHVIVTNNSGMVMRYDRNNMRLLKTWPEFHAAQCAIEMPDGTLVIAHTTEGKMTRTLDADGKETQLVADKLAAPISIAAAGNGDVYVSELMAGRILRVSVATGTKQIVANGLDRPQGIAVTNDGGVLVVEVGRKQLTRVGPRTGTTTVVARDLPVGLENVPLTLASVTAGANGTIYVTSDVENSIWRLTPK